MHFRLATIVALLASAALPALADSYPVSGGTGGFSGSGTLTVTGNGHGAYTITGISGSDGSGVTGLLPVGTYTSSGNTYTFTNDNILYPGNTSPQSANLDGQGFAFTDTQGDTDYEVDIFASGSNAYQAYVFDQDQTDAMNQRLNIDFNLGTPATNSMVRELANLPLGETRTFSYNFAAVAATPEPSAIVLLGTGFLGIAGLLHRRRD